MAYRNLREFMARLERDRELRRIGEPVDVDLEITEITDRVSKAGGPALLFEKTFSTRRGHSGRSEHRVPCRDRDRPEASQRRGAGQAREGSRGADRGSRHELQQMRRDPVL
jgi:hypothetical protein